MATLSFGPPSGTLHLLTGVEGKAARMGHNLVLDLSDWSAEAELADGGTDGGTDGTDGQVPTALRFRAALASFAVDSGTGGAKALSDKDRTTIRKNALGAMKADRHPEVSFTSTAVEATGDGFTVTGDLSVAGQTRPTVLQVTRSGATLTARTSVVQTSFGVEPYSAMLGALRLRDRVDVELTTTLPA